MAKAQDSFFQRNKGWLIPVGILALLAFILIAWIAGSYNGLVGSRENVNNQFADLDASYQRRADLIPNLVQIVAGAANFEKSVLENVTAARASVGQTHIDAGDLSDPAKMQAYQQAQASLSGALSRLLVVSENYPQLQSNQNFLSLQDQLEGTENRINVARQDYNKAAKEYNIQVQRFPAVIVARLFGFEKVEYFEAKAGAENAPPITASDFG